jgi:hypothetical protein
MELAQMAVNSNISSTLPYHGNCFGEGKEISASFEQDG